MDEDGLIFGKKPEALAAWAGTVVVTLFSLTFMHRMPRTRGRVFGRTGILGFLLGLLFHAGYVAAVCAILMALPNVAPGLDG